MATKYKTRAFIFKKKDRNEFDRVFSVFTEDFGRLDIFAKAIRKNISKLRSGVDIFFMSELEFVQGKNRKTLTDAVLIEKYSSIIQDSGKFKIANKIGQTLDNFVRGEEKDKEIFDLLKEVMKLLNSQKEAKKLLIYYFLWNALHLLGYKPEVSKCNICQQNLEQNCVYFSNKLGGTICKKCLGSDILAFKVEADVIKILRLIFKKQWQILAKLKVSQLSQKMIEKISDSYYSYMYAGNGIINKIK